MEAKGSVPDKRISPCHEQQFDRVIWMSYILVIYIYAVFAALYFSDFLSVNNNDLDFMELEYNETMNRITNHSPQ